MVWWYIAWDVQRWQATSIPSWRLEVRAAKRRIGNSRRNVLAKPDGETADG
jgi:hypothetical protein